MRVQRLLVGANDPEVLDAVVLAQLLIQQASRVFYEFQVRSVHFGKGHLVFALDNDLGLGLQSRLADFLQIFDPNDVIDFHRDARHRTLGMRHSGLTSVVPRVLRQFVRTGTRRRVHEIEVDDFLQGARFVQIALQRHVVVLEAFIR